MIGGSLKNGVVDNLRILVALRKAVLLFHWKKLCTNLKSKRLILSRFLHLLGGALKTLHFRSGNYKMKPAHTKMQRENYN